MKIIDNRTKQEPEFKVGECVEFSHNNTDYLCIIAQTSGGRAKLICLEDGNRFSDTELDCNFNNVVSNIQEFVGKGIVVKKVNATLTIDNV
jgi:hypothetical protein